MSFAKDDLIAVLRLRYDYYSASNVFDAARERASVGDKATYDAADVRAIREVLPKVGDRLTAVLERFDELLGGAPAGKDAGAKKEDKKADAPKPPAEVKAEKSDKAAKAPADEKKADEAPKAEVKVEKSDKAESAKADEKKADEPKADDKADAAS
jgi:hypothetical protein